MISKGLHITSPLLYGNISHPGHVEIYHTLSQVFYHTMSPVLISHQIRPNLTLMLIVFRLLPGDFFLSHLLPKSLFLHALVIVNSQTYHISDKNPFIISHVCGGTWRMTHCLHAFIVNITLEAEVRLKYHTCHYSPLFSP
jgi:hypothetical protein